MANDSSNSNGLTKGIAFPLASDLYGGIEMADHVRSIEDSIRIILSVSPGEFFLEPEFGCKINDIVFLPDSPETITLAEYHIRKALERWEPRIILKEVRGSIDSVYKNTVNLFVTYEIPALKYVGTLQHNVTTSE